MAARIEEVTKMSAIPDVGSMFAGYRLDEKVGAGNMGAVFKAWNPTQGVDDP